MNQRQVKRRSNPVQHDFSATFSHIGKVQRDCAPCTQPITNAQPSYSLGPPTTRRWFRAGRVRDQQLGRNFYKKCVQPVSSEIGCPNEVLPGYVQISMGILSIGSCTTPSGCVEIRHNGCDNELICRTIETKAENLMLHRGVIVCVAAASKRLRHRQNSVWHCYD